MKKTLYLILSALLAVPVMAQQLPDREQRAAVKWAPTGLIFGNISLQGEYNFGAKRSVTARIGVPVSARHAFVYEDKDVDFEMKATTVGAGYRMYLSKKPMRGLYVEPFAKYVHHRSEGVGAGTLDEKRAVMDFTNVYNAVGAGAQLGAQFFLGKRMVVDVFFLGPEINSATSNLKAVETSNTIPWTAVEAEDAENAIRSFVNQFPFVKDRTNIKVDQASRTVTADFKGALPGYRAGISIGIAL